MTGRTSPPRRKAAKILLMSFPVSWERQEAEYENRRIEELAMKRDENKNVEYKESWHDKYLEWICGYAIELFTEGGNSL